MSIKTETHGQAAERVICNLNSIPNSLKKRSHPIYEEKLKPLIQEALKKLPKVVKHAGLNKGLRGGQSKSKVDFYLEGNQTLSLKCFKGTTMACAPEVGQSSWETLEKYYKDLLQENSIQHLDEENYKLLLHTSIHKFVPIQLDQLFSCNFLLSLSLKEEKYKIITRKMYKEKISIYSWKFENFKATKTGVNWGKSINYRYNNISLINAQIHSGRTPMKFRFNLKNLCKLFDL